MLVSRCLVTFETRYSEASGEKANGNKIWSAEWGSTGQPVSRNAIAWSATSSATRSADLPFSPNAKNDVGTVGCRNTTPMTELGPFAHCSVGMWVSISTSFNRAVSC